MATQAPVTFNGTVQTELSALAHKHVTLTYSILGVLVLALVLAGFGGWLSIRGYERALQRAEAAEEISKQHEAVFSQQITAMQTMLKQDEADRMVIEAQKSTLESQIAARAKAPVPVAVETGLKPDATAAEAATALGIVSSVVGAPVVPQATPDGKVAVSVKESQQVASELLAGSRAGADLADTRALFTLEQSKSSSLSNDLTQCQAVVEQGKATIKSQNETIDKYKSAAKKSKFQKFLNGAEKVGLFLAGAYVGHRL